MSWGVENLTPQQRFVKAVKAGVDQFGGVTDSQLLVSAVKEKQLTEERLNESVIRILSTQTGPFENCTSMRRKRYKPLAARTAAERSRCRTGAFAGAAAKYRRSVTAEKGPEIWLYGIAPKAAEAAGFTVDSPEKADVALIRAQTPYENCTSGMVLW